MIPHASSNFLSALSLRITVIGSALRRLSMSPAGSFGCLDTADIATEFAAIHMPPVTNSVDNKINAADAALDDIKFRCPPGETKNWTPGVDDPIMSLSTRREQRDAEGCGDQPLPPFLPSLQRSSRICVFIRQFSACLTELIDFRTGSLTNLHSCGVRGCSFDCNTLLTSEYRFQSSHPILFNSLLEKRRRTRRSLQQAG
jgi:hypothetical protein